MQAVDTPDTPSSGPVDMADENSCFNCQEEMNTGVFVASNNSRDDDILCCSERRKKIYSGCVIVILLAFSWAGTQQFAQDAVRLDGFNAPYFTTWIGTCWMMLCFPFYCLFVALKYREKDRIRHMIWDSGRIFETPCITIKQFFTKVVSMNILWLATNYVYIFGLKFIAATDASAIFASNVAFVYMLSLCMLKERSYIIRILACIFCISGVVLFGYSYGFDGGTKLLVGAIMAVAAAFGAALYKVVFKLWVGEATLGQVSLFLSLLGLSNSVFMWIIFLILYYTGVEHFHGDDIPWIDLTISNFLGLVFNFTINFGVAYTYPLFISIAMMLGIPLNAAFDVLVKDVTFSTTRMIAAFAVIFGFCIMLLPDHLNDPIHDVLLCKVKKSDESRDSPDEATNADKFGSSSSQKNEESAEEHIHLLN